MAAEQMTIERAWQILLEINERTMRIEQQLLLLAQPAEKKDEGFLTVEQAAKLLGIKVSTLYGKVSHREVPYYKHGKILQFDKQELVDWVLAARRRTTAERLEEIRPIRAKTFHRRR